VLVWLDKATTSSIEIRWEREKCKPERERNANTQVNSARCIAGVLTVGYIRRDINGSNPSSRMMLKEALIWREESMTSIFASGIKLTSYCLVAVLIICGIVLAVACLIDWLRGNKR